MILKTKRLILRPWEAADAKSLYSYAKDPRVGPAAGWPAHTSVENSEEIISHVLAVSETYAVCLKADNKAIGSIGLLIGEKGHRELPPDEAEVGYWIGVPFWGQGLIPEAVMRLMQHAFAQLGMKKLWCGYFDGNTKSKRVQEKCGFQYYYTNENIEWKVMHDIRTEHVSCITQKEWRKQMGELSQLPNIGKELQRQLNQVNINTFQELDALGAKGAWLKIKEIDNSVCIHRLLALEGALQGVKKTQLSEDCKAELRAFYQAHKK